MPKKRKNAGRRKGEKGRVKYVQCSICGRVIPEDKAIKKVVLVPLVPPEIRQELERQMREAQERGEEFVLPPYIPVKREVRYYCISCAVHHHIVRIRPRDERKPQGDIFLS